MGCSQNKGEMSEDVSPSQSELSLKDGDVICRLRTGFFSKHFRERASKDKIYSHIGVVETASDTTFVIHVEASELTGIGFVKREPIDTFLDGVTTWGIYRTNLPDSVCEKISKTAKVYFDRKTPFDLDFETDDDSKVYCTELVALSINQASDSTLIVPTMKMGDKRCYALDDIYKINGIKKIY